MYLYIAKGVDKVLVDLEQRRLAAHEILEHI